MNPSKKKAAGLSALKNLTPSASTDEAESTKPKAKKTSKTTTKKKSTSPSPTPAQPTDVEAPSPTPIKSFNLNLPLEAHKKLREIAFHEEDTMTSLILDGINLLFAERGLPPVAKAKS